MLLLFLRSCPAGIHGFTIGSKLWSTETCCVIFHSNSPVGRKNRYPMYNPIRRQPNNPPFPDSSPLARSFQSYSRDNSAVQASELHRLCRRGHTSSAVGVVGVERHGKAWRWCVWWGEVAKRVSECHFLSGRVPRQGAQPEDSLSQAEGVAVECGEGCCPLTPGWEK